MEPNKPKVGVGLLVVKDGKYILLQERKNAHGEGEFATPGGHLEYMESFSGGALRELKEECGAQFKVSKPKFLCLANLTKYAPKHYAHVHLIANWQSGEPKLMEPQKGKNWKWYPIDKLPEPQFETTKISVEAFKTGKNFFE